MFASKIQRENDCNITVLESCECVYKRIHLTSIYESQWKRNETEEASNNQTNTKTKTKGYLNYVGFENPIKYSHA